MRQRLQPWVLRLVFMVLAELCLTGWAGAADSGSPDPDPGDSPLISEIRVEIEGAGSRQAFYERMARSLIRLQAGQRLTQAAVEAAIDALKLSRRFAAIQADSQPAGAGERVIFKLRPYRLIKDIQIQGKYPLFERDILNQMTFYPGDVLRDEELAQQTEAIARRYQREGYVDPKISLSADQDSPDGQTVVRVIIDKGPHYTLGRLTFEGNRAISTAVLRLKMKTWRASLLGSYGRFGEYQLKKDVERLIEAYREQGYADVKLSYRLLPEADPNRIDVRITVEEGPRYELSFEGNRYFWNWTLKKDLVLFKEGNPRGLGLRKSLQKIRQRYHQAGYLDTQIKVQEQADTRPDGVVRRIRLIIDEGPCTIVSRVRIEGHAALSQEEIGKQILTRPPTAFRRGAYVPETLDEDLFAIRTLYLNKGFLDVQVERQVRFSEDRRLASIQINLHEGTQTTVRSITLEGLGTISESQASRVLGLKINAPLRSSGLQEDENELAALVSEKGHPHVKVKSRVNFSPDRSQADVVYHIDPGPAVTLGQIFISGNLKTREKKILQELKAAPGEPLSLLRLSEGQRALRDQAIFNSVQYQTSGLKEKDETVNLMVQVEEHKPYFAQMGVGYESDQGLFARAKAGNHNLLGLNKDIWAGAEVSEIGYRVESRLTEPRFWGSQTTASLGVYKERLIEFNQSFGSETVGASLGFGREWGDEFSSALSFRLEQRNQFSVDGTPPEDGQFDPRTVWVTTPHLRYDSRDSFVRPTRGWLSSLSVDISKGIDNSLDDFIQYRFDTRYFFTPIKGLTLAWLARLGQIFPYGDNRTVPADQLFFLGGINDVRGFEENLLRFDENGDPVGGKTAVVGGFEARIDLGWNLELTTFFDSGSVQEAVNGGGSDEFRSSVGMGLRYITPIGPIGLLYGYKLDPKEGEAPGRIHLSIGYTF